MHDSSINVMPQSRLILLVELKPGTQGAMVLSAVRRKLDAGTPKAKTWPQLRKQAKKDNVRILKQMGTFREKLVEGESIDVVAQGIPGGYQAVVTLETGYLNDPTLADLADGTFTVVGKVTKLVPAGNSGISLLRRSSLTVMPPGIFEQMMESLAELSAQESFNLPSPDLEVPGPAMQVIPMAIFA